MSLMLRRAAASAVLALLFLTLFASAAAGGAREGQPIALGAFIGDSYRYPSLYDQWADDVGRRPVVLNSYKAWTIPLIDEPQLQEMWERGAVPIVTWEPWDESGAPVFPLREIAAGAFDPYIRRSARAAAAWGRPLFLRFAHEMNGGWYPWGRGHGDTAKQYRESWHHIVRIFEAEGAGNVRWIWCPNENSTGRFAFQPYYPGDDFVDWIGIDGFNWELSPRWQSFDEIFASTYNSLLAMTDKPMMIVETGSWEHGGDKAAWVRDALEEEIPRYSHIRAFLWWSVDDSRGDLRVDSSPAALRAARTGLASPYYGATREELLATPSRLEQATPVPVPGAGEPSASKLRRGLKDNSIWLAIGALAISVGALLLVVLKRHRGLAIASVQPPSEEGQPQDARL